MKIRQLTLKNFRNCENVNIDFSKLKTLIIGKNAQGKTNILESIYLMTDLKSPRSTILSDLIKFGANEFEINAIVEKNETDIELGINYTADKKRVLKVNKVKCSPKNFKNVVKTVLFSTKDLLLLRGTPQDRRDWLDRAISQIYSAYGERLSVYDKFIIKKNNL
jgi:DNA replication and repair protein RecF